MRAFTRGLILISVTWACIMLAGCGSGNSGTKTTAQEEGAYPSQEQCSLVKVGMTFEAAVSMLGSNVYTFSREGVLLQAGWCYGSCEPATGGGVFIATVNDGMITKVQFSAEAHFGDGI